MSSTPVTSAAMISAAHKRRLYCYQDVSFIAAARVLLRLSGPRRFCPYSFEGAARLLMAKMPRSRASAAHFRP